METDSVIIKSSANLAEFQFSERDGLFRSDGSEYYRLTLKAEDFMASTKIYAWNPFGESCCDYFVDLADNWRGWIGKKCWRSLESELTISSESDALGHITMEIVLESYGNWRGQITVYFDAGQLEDIASKVKRFFSKQEVIC